MAFVAICHDREGDEAQRLRASELQAHLDYVASIKDQVLVAGPLNRDASPDFNASLFVYAVDSAAAARQLLEDDPYFKAGIYANVSIAAFTPARGTWL